MKKLIIVLFLLVSFKSFSYVYRQGNFFASSTVTGTTTIYSSAQSPYSELSFDWSSSGEGVFTAQASNDSVNSTSEIVNWYDISKDRFGVALSMSATVTTPSGLVDLGHYDQKWIRLKYVPDSGTSSVSTTTLNSKFTTKGW